MTLELSLVESAMLKSVLLMRAKEQIKTYAYYKNENKTDMADIFRNSALEKFRVYKRLKDGLKV